MLYPRKMNVSKKENFHHEVEFDSSSPRCGKWSSEEEDYANAIITEFETGTLTDCPEGSTLGSYLAKRLNCAPMRISKKFAGQCIGKVRPDIFNILLSFYFLTQYFPLFS